MVVVVFFMMNKINLPIGIMSFGHATPECTCFYPQSPLYNHVPRCNSGINWAHNMIPMGKLVLLIIRNNNSIIWIILFCQVLPELHLGMCFYSHHSVCPGITLEVIDQIAWFQFWMNFIHHQNKIFPPLQSCYLVNYFQSCTCAYVSIHSHHSVMCPGVTLPGLTLFWAHNIIPTREFILFIKKKVFPPLESFYAVKYFQSCTWAHTRLVF
jgi:hypothetical protein